MVRGNPAWKKGIKSPNPSGRPKGIVDKRSKISNALLDDADKIARVVVQAALNGDLQASSIVLSKVAPSIRPQLEKVEFNFDAGKSLTNQVEDVMRAISLGQISVTTGKEIIDALSRLSEIKLVDEIEERIAKLESRSD